MVEWTGTVIAENRIFWKCGQGVWHPAHFYYSERQIWGKSHARIFFQIDKQMVLWYTVYIIQNEISGEFV